MERYLYKFKVDEKTGISPAFHKNKLLKLYNKESPELSMDIHGSTNSLVLISKVADYFYWETAKEIQWKYKPSNLMNSDTIIAVIKKH